MKIENWLSALHKPTRRVKRRGKSRSCESLEVKALLSVTMDFGADDGELEVKSSADDAIVIGASADGTDVLINGESTGVAPAQVRKLEVTGGPLANSIDISAVTDEVFSNLSTIELKGNAGDDTLVGSEFDDEIRGGSGDDEIDGREGDDELKGDAGDDELDGGDGDDLIGGREGNDLINGGDGNDTIGAGGDADTVLGGRGNDSIKAGSGSDSVMGEGGHDIILGGSGKDSIDGANGNDTVSGQHGSDSISGGNGDDHLRGNRGKDQLDGQAGADSLNGGSSDDLLKGGDDDDTLNGGRGDDLLDGDDGDDDEHHGFSTDLESTFVADLEGVDGEAEFERDVEGDIELEFELEIEDATPGVYEVDIDGVSIGQITVDATGNGKLEYSTEPDDDGEEQLPADFPQIVEGSTITVTGLGSGTFAQYEDIELETVLTPLNDSGVTGEVKLEADGPEREFELEAEDVVPGTYDLIIDGVVVDTVTVTDDEIEIKYKQDDEENSFPENFPAIDVGSTIELAGIASGLF